MYVSKRINILLSLGLDIGVLLLLQQGLAENLAYPDSHTYLSAIAQIPTQTV